MSSLEGKLINNTYKDLLQISNNNVGIDGTTRYIEDGEGTTSVLGLNTSSVTVSGNILPETNMARDIGSVANHWNKIYTHDLWVHGNIGIGTESPAYTLDIVGDINLTGSLKVNGADAVFSNWNVNGSDIYRGTGNVGIGTTDPLTMLHIQDNDTNTSLTSLNTRSITIQDTSLVNDTLSYINFTTSNNFSSGMIGVRNTTNVAGASVRSNIFFANRNDDGTFTEKMTIKPGGNVGIGTTDPIAPLHIYSATPQQNGNQNYYGNLVLQRGYSNNWNRIRFDDANGDAEWGVAVNHQTKFTISRLKPDWGAPGSSTSADDSVLVADLSGNVGIGTSTPTNKIQIGDLPGGSTHTGYGAVITSDSRYGGIIHTQTHDIPQSSDNASAWWIRSYRTVDTLDASEGGTKDLFRFQNNARLIIAGGSTVGTSTYEGVQLQNNPSASVQVNGFGTSPPERNSGLFLNASTKGGHPALLLGHNNAISWSVKSDPDQSHGFAILKHNFRFNDTTNIAEPDLTGTYSVLKITDGSEISEGRAQDLSHYKWTFRSGTRASEQNPLNEFNQPRRDPSFSFHNEIEESTLTSGGLGYNYDNPTLVRFSQTYNHTATTDTNGDHLDIGIMGLASNGHYAGMGISTGWLHLYLRARHADLSQTAPHGGAHVQIRNDHGVYIYGDGVDADYGQPNYSHKSFLSTFTTRLPNGGGTTIAASGNVGVSATSQRTGGIGVYNHNGLVEASPYMWLQRSNDASTHYFWVDPAGSTGNLKMSQSSSHIGTSNGAVVGDQTSDERLKDIEQDFEYGLDTVIQLKPIAFKMKDDPDAVRKLGFGAQTTQSIVPEAVYDSHECLHGYDEQQMIDEEDGMPNMSSPPEQTCRSHDTKLMMEYVQLVPVLTRAIQQLSEKVDQLQSQINTLQNT